MEQVQLSTSKRIIVGVQFLFVAFGATVLVPILVGLDPSTALLTAGLGTFIFHFITKGKVPIFLGSSFAFIAPIISASKQWGMTGGRGLWERWRRRRQCVADRQRREGSRAQNA